MAWTEPSTWSTGESITAARMNTDVRDNTNFLHNPPNAQLRLSAGQTGVSSGSWTTIEFDTEGFDNDSMGDTGNNRFNVNTAGKYIVGAHARTNQTAGEHTLIRIRKNGATNLAVAGAKNSTSEANRPAVSVLEDFTTSDTVQAQVLQDSGGTTTISASPDTVFWIAWQAE